jgi:hypothetical protein
MMAIVRTPDQDADDRYIEDRYLLSMTIQERDQLLKELEALAKVPQGNGTTEQFMQFDITKANMLLYELAIKGNKIDDLMMQINVYAAKFGLPPVGSIYSVEQDKETDRVGNVQS